MADDPLLALQDSDYNSASDEEFDPTAAEEAAADDASISSSDDEGETKKRAKPAKKSGKRKRRAGDDDDELDSGDEATIAAARRRHQQQRGGNKKQRQEAEGDDDVELLSDDGGEGGLVKTRAQRRAEKKERRPLARVDGATADVDAIWATLSTAPVAKTNDEAKGDVGMRGEEAGKGQEEAQDAIRQGEVEEEMITIKRTYDFAGDRITEERQVSKSSAEAKLYLAQQQEKLEKQLSSSKKVAESSATPDTDRKDIVEGEGEQETDKPAVRRPLHRPSRFDSNPTAEVKGLSPEKQLTWARRRALLDPTAATPLPAFNTTGAQDTNAAAAAAKKSREKAQKLNTVDKSRLDWAGYVDKEGIADELDEYGRAKEGYLGRMDFLTRVDERREEERRAAKAALRT